MQGFAKSELATDTKLKQSEWAVSRSMKKESMKKEKKDAGSTKDLSDKLKETNNARRANRAAHDGRPLR
ncbi:hypothetical protein [Streptomyces sp. NPDC014733]|uniref:hypothetical protein n=1 Tax=Streptomyces sp. NPDC014733 TaxID=3364885 RepID=UPI0036F8F177